MGDNTGIEWCDYTFNPWVGCQKVAPECDNCYAEAWNKRFGGENWGPRAQRRRTSAQNWKQPFKWNRWSKAFQEANGRRPRVFCASLADVFDNAVDTAWRKDLWNLIRECTELDWLLLTKRPQNIMKMLPEDWEMGWPHVWLGTTAGTQETADIHIHHLLETPAAIRFVSVEPMLGAVDLRSISPGHYFINSLAGVKYHDAEMPATEECAKLDWVICGGESGPGARPMHPDWARDLRDQCVKAGVPFLFKQWGDWAPVGPYDEDDATEARLRHSRMRDDYVFSDKFRMMDANGNCWENDIAQPPGHCYGFERVSKKKAGRLLDGRLWDEYPEVRA